MNEITLFTVDPTGKHEADVRSIERFRDTMEQLYGLFDFHFTQVPCPGTLSMDRHGKYQVKKIQNAVLPLLQKSSYCFLIFFCRMEELSGEELTSLMDQLIKDKKNAVRACFGTGKNLRAVLTDISSTITRINDRIPVPEADRDRISQMEREFYAQGIAANRSGNASAAEVLLNRALMMQRKLVLSDREKYLPDLAAPYHELGTLFLTTSRLKDAETMYRSALEIRQTMMKERGEQFAPEVAGSLNNLGILYAAQDRNDEAEASYLEAEKMYFDLEEKQPESRIIRLSLADTRANLGNLYLRMKKNDEASSAFAHALTSLEPAAMADGASEPERMKFVNAANSQGILLNATGKYEEARDLLLKAEKLAEGLSGEKPDEYEPRLAQIEYNLGVSFSGLKEMKEAARCQKRMTEICEARKDSSVVCKNLLDMYNRQRDAAISQQTEAARKAEAAAEAAVRAGNMANAKAAYHNAAQLYQRLPGAEQKLKAARMYHQMGEINWDEGQLDQAEICFKNEVVLCRGTAEYDENRKPELAEALFHLGRFEDEAREMPDNGELKEAFSIAEIFRNTSEKARDIYENLSDGVLLDRSDEV